MANVLELVKLGDQRFDDFRGLSESQEGAGLKNQGALALGPGRGNDFATRFKTRQMAPSVEHQPSGF